MSSFLPEGGSSSPGITPASHALPGEEDIALMQKVLGAAASRPNAIPETFMSYLLDWLQVSNIQIPIGQVPGFSQFQAQAKTGAFSPTSFSNTTFADPPNGAFTLAALPKGRYLMIYGAALSLPSGGHGNIGTMQLYYAPAAAVFDSQAQFKRTWNGVTALQDDSTVSVVGFALFDLTNDSNDISMQVAVANAVPTADAVSIGNRFILGLRYANL